MVDFNLSYESPTLIDEYDLIVQQVELLFDTNPKEVLGDPDFGTSYSDFLYNLLLSNGDIEAQVIRDLSKLDLLGFQFDVKATILAGTENDIILLQIAFYKGNQVIPYSIKITK